LPGVKPEAEFEAGDMEVEFDISKPQKHAARAQPKPIQKAQIAYIGDPGNAPSEGMSPANVGF
jgi:hypothetical protein